MTMQSDIVRTVAVSLTATLNRQTRDDLAGRLFAYHFLSFPIHVKTLAERVHDVIRKTAEVYLSHYRSIRKLCEHYKQAINQEMPAFLNEIRNNFAHPTKQSWAKTVTEEHNWEPSVVIGQTPRLAHDMLFYPQQGSPFRSGKYAHFVDAAEMILNDIGEILHDLEQDQMASYKFKYRMSSGR